MIEVVSGSCVTRKSAGNARLLSRVIVVEWPFVIGLDVALFPSNSRSSRGLLSWL